MSYELTRDDRDRLASIATAIEGLIADGLLHPDYADRDVRFLRRLAFSGPACDHGWADIRNAAIESGEMCLKCHALRPGNESDTTEDQEP